MSVSMQHSMLHMHSSCLSIPWGLCPSSSSPLNMFSHVLGKLDTCSKPPIITSAHTIYPQATHSHQPTSTYPCIQPAPTSLMPCTQHLIITAAQPCLALKPPSPHTRNYKLSHQCHAPPHRVNTTCYCLSSQPSLPTMALLYHGLGASRGARCLHMLPFITAHRSNSNRKSRQVLLKKPLGASLVRHEESWVCWENMKPSDWPNAAQAPSFLMPSSTTRNAPNTVLA